jgi:hypothetical protein
MVASGSGRPEPRGPGAAGAAEVAFVPQFEKDLFISYAWVDDAPVQGIEDSKWVTNLRVELERRLSQGLGRKGKADVWMDTCDMHGNDPVRSTLDGAVSRSAVLLVVLSHAYLESRWCARERAEFLSACGGADAARGRIFVVQRDDLPREQWPEDLRDVAAYEFFVRDPVRKRARLLADPRPKPDEKAWWESIADLRSDLAAQLERQRAGAQAPEPHSAPDTLPTGPAVVLGPVPAEHAEVARRLTVALQGEGVRVLADGGVQPAAHGILFVQLLGAAGTPSGAGASQEQRWVDAVRSAPAGDERRLLLWRSPATKPADVPDAAHRALLEDPAILAADQVELKRDILERLRRLDIAQRAVPVPGQRIAILDAAGVDRQLAEEVGAALAQVQIDHVQLGEQDSVHDFIRAVEDVYAILLVQGQASLDWLCRRVLEMRGVVLNRRPRLAVWALCQGPPFPKPKLPFHFSSLEIVPVADAAGLRRLLERLRDPQAAA